MCIAIHKAMGGKSAIVVDIDPDKREAAKQAGAELVFDGGTPDAAQQIIAATNGGAWAVIDLVGSSATARLGIDSLIKGGKYIIVGLYGGDITLSLPPFPMRAITDPGLLRRQPAGDAGTDRARPPHRPAAGAGRDAAARRRECGDDRPARRQDRRPRGADAGLEPTKEKQMDATELRAMQAPIKDRYKSDPGAALITLKAKGSLDDRTSRARSRPAARSRSPACIRRPAGREWSSAPATCCWRRWWPAPASR